ncbi:MAG: chitobiase/beta-hexosaminidase C-terminal domain-containing protein [Leptospira sp.]|nr:chitobiase/beta-hexosaminidase C-terminal domain-containing protein [Leptospira sp.]
MVFSFFSLIIISCSLPTLDRSYLDINTFFLFSNRDNNFFLGGLVRNLEGSGLRLELNLSSPSGSNLSPEVLELNQSDFFQFPNSYPKDYKFVVSILSQPNNPAQICDLSPSEGIISSSSNRILQVSCEIGSSALVMPVYSPPPGEYSSTISLSISSTDSNAEIFYTTDGTDPICGVGNLYTGSINLASPTLPQIEFRSISCLNGDRSNISIGVFRVTNGVLDPPNISPAPGTFFDDLTLEIFPPAIPGSTIRYTIDGTSPNCNSTIFPNPFSIGISTDVRAISCHPDWTNSSVVSFSYTINGTVAIPGFTIETGSFINDQNLTLTISTPSAEIRYTSNVGTDPPDPDCSTSNIFSTPILLNTNDTRIKARGCRVGWTASSVSSRTYQFIVATPTINPIGQAVTGSINLTGSTTTTGAIVYMGDGSNPGCTGSTSINLSPTGTSTEVAKTIFAQGCRAGYANSLEATENYTLTGIIGSLNFTPSEGVYTTSPTINLVPGDPYPAGTFVRYTTDGSTPTCSTGLTWSGSFTPSGGLTQFKAIACKTSPEWLPSGIFEASYNIINPALCNAGDANINYGSGTAIDPYYICNVEQLQSINSVGLSSYYYQVSNIDASDTVTWNSGEGFIPIGFNSPHFSGYYNGLGNVISLLTVNRPGAQAIGLFGRLTNSAIVENIRLVNCSMTGSNQVGGVVGQIINNSIVRRSSSNCTITGGSQNVGGLVGDCRAGSSISRSFAAGTVTGGTTQIGGLLGSTFGSVFGSSCEISDSYTIASVSGGSASRAGLAGTYCSGCRIINSYANNSLGAGYSGLTGTGDNTNLINSYWNTDVSGIFTSSSGFPRTSNQLQCPTSPGETCSGETTFDGWSSEIWKFGTNAEFPCLLGITPGCN